MNILDENVPESQRALLLSKRVHVHQIGQDIGRQGMTDDEIIPLLHHLDRPTFFTLDGDFYNRRLYCLVHLDVEEDSVADCVRRLLRHRELRTKSKRMGLVIRAMTKGLTLWRFREKQEVELTWS